MAALLFTFAALVAGCGGVGGPPRPTVDLAGVVPDEETLDDGAISHLQYVLTPEQQEAFLALPMDDRAELLRVAWAELDPTPTTPENERRIEHYRRLAFVRTHFAIEKPPGWDKRGELLLRYGPPDERRTAFGDVVVGVGLVPPKEVWLYRWLGAAFELEDARFQGNFQDAFAQRKSTRPDVDRDVSSLGADADVPPGAGRPVRETANVAIPETFEPTDAEAAMARERLSHMVEQGQVTLRDRPRAYRHDYGGAKLDVVFDVQSFSDEGSGKTRLQVNVALWAKDLQFAIEGDHRDAAMDVEVTLKTRDYHDVVRARRMAHDRRGVDEDLTGRLVLDQTTLVVDPGEYRLALSVSDSLSHRIGIFRTDVDAAPFPPGVFAMSDVQRAAEVHPAPHPDAPFVKGGLQVVPYPPGTYPRDRDIYLYFEVYGLTLSPTGDALYTVAFVVRPRTVTTASWFGSSKGRVVPGVATSYGGNARSANVQEYFALDPKTFDEGVYDVEVSVTDQVADRGVSRQVSFGVAKR